jgi:hypothetical protein
LASSKFILYSAWLGLILQATVRLKVDRYLFSDHKGYQSLVS